VLTNDDSQPRQRMAEQVRAQLAALGFELTVALIPFEQMSTALFAQQFDLAVVGWDNLGPDPASSAFWHSRDDLPGSGLNFVSLQDPDVDAWVDAAAQGPDCTPERRAPLYHQLQERIQATLPYVFLGGPLQVWGINGSWPRVRVGTWGIQIVN
jgi:peptide/nickel transport system substrate-binding protein